MEKRENYKEVSAAKKIMANGIKFIQQLFKRANNTVYFIVDRKKVGSKCLHI